jgi:hypothetical protein
MHHVGLVCNLGKKRVGPLPHPARCRTYQVSRNVIADNQPAEKCTYVDILTIYNDLADKGDEAGGIVLIPGKTDT